MGEVAEMMLDGTLCQTCGALVDGTTPGYPRYCEDCAEYEINEEIKLLEYDFNFNKVGIEKLAEEVMQKGTIKQKKAIIKVCYALIDKLKISCKTQIKLQEKL